MKAVLCLVFVIGYVAAEYCSRDSDCSLTKCAPGYRVDCHSVRGVNDCTCVATDDHHCFDDNWCALNMYSSCHKDGKSWHCSTHDRKCRCYCDRHTRHCDDDDDDK